MNYWIKRVAIVGLLINMIGCGTYRNVYYNYDRSVDFAGYRTFAWIPDSTEIASDDN